MKYLTLIRAIALLHQYQRAIKTVTRNSQSLRYIEVAESDIALANRIAHEVLGRTLDELPPQTRVLLARLQGWVSEECAKQACLRPDYRFTRKQVRGLTGWGDTQAKLHLSRLAELEYVLIHRVKHGQAYEYELLYDGEGDAGQPFVMGLAALNHAYDKERSGQKPDRSGRGRPLVGGQSGGGRTSKTAADGQKTTSTGESPPESAETHIMEEIAPVLSYAHNGSGLLLPAASAAGA